MDGCGFSFTITVSIGIYMLWLGLVGSSGLGRPLLYIALWLSSAQCFGGNYFEQVCLDGLNCLLLGGSKRGGGRERRTRFFGTVLFCSSLCLGFDPQTVRGTSLYSAQCVAGLGHVSYVSDVS